MDMNNIIARLKNGEDAQAIANEMAETLNKAVASVAAESKNTDRKTQLAQEIADRVNEYAELQGLEDAVLTAEDVEHIFGEVYDLVTSLNGIIDGLFAEKKQTTPRKAKVIQKSSDDVIADFLNTFINK